MDWRTIVQQRLPYIELFFTFLKLLFFLHLLLYKSGFRILFPFHSGSFHCSQLLVELYPLTLSVSWYCPDASVYHLFNTVQEPAQQRELWDTCKSSVSHKVHLVPSDTAGTLGVCSSLHTRATGAAVRTLVGHLCSKQSVPADSPAAADCQQTWRWSSLWATAAAAAVRLLGHLWQRVCCKPAHCRAPPNYSSTNTKLIQI